MHQELELIELYRRLIEAYNTRDIAFLRDVISQEDGTSVIGSDPGEWWHGYTSFMAAMGTGIEERSSGAIRAEPGEAEAYREGTVGWVVASPVYHVAAGGLFPARMTLIAHLEDGHWKVVQQHISFGVLNGQMA